MAVLAGSSADVYIATGAGTSMTGEAVTSLGGGVYQITDAAKRAINPNAALTVLDGVSTIPASNYSVGYGAGKITLTGGYTLGGTMTVTGSYLTLAQLGQGFEWSMDVEVQTEETHTFGDTWKERTAVMKSASVAFQRFYSDGYFTTNIGTFFVLALYINVSGADRWLCAARCPSFNINAPENGVLRENVQFLTHGAVDFATS